MTSKLKSPVVEKVVDRLDESVAELGGLHQWSIKALHFFIIEVAKIPKYRLSIFYKTEPKQIVIHTYTEQSLEFFIKPKDNDMLQNLSGKIGIPNYLIRFANKDDVYDRKNAD